MFHDPNVRLVRNVHIDVFDPHGAFLEESLSRRDKDARRELEDLASVHVDVAVCLRVSDPS